MNMIRADIPLSDIENPSESQRRAANPDKHVWVRASAGSGKTTVLVKRVLRLLLPDPITGAAGTTPERILCITFTKAGATNMSIRVQDTLMKWSICTDNELQKELLDIFGQAELHETVISSARQLFAMILDRPDRLRIMTIHSFCQSILARFPLEAGLSPSMTVLEDSTAKNLQKKSFEKILLGQSQTAAGNIKYLFDLFNFQALKKLIEQTLSSSHINYIFKLLSDNKIELDKIYADHFGIQISDLKQPAENFVSFSLKDIDLWRQIADKFRLQGKGVAFDTAQRIDKFIAMDEDQRLSCIHDIISCMRVRPRNNSLKEDVGLQNLYEYFDQKINQLQLAQEVNATIGIIQLAYMIYKDYQSLKQIQNVVDYNDLILRTENLLSSDITWVHYKLDGGIDHILLDESQDTTPAQWNIIQKLSEEMFTIAPDIVPDRKRSLFVVGDEKQSIFSFQGADPQVFHDMLEYFKVKTSPYQDKLEESLRYSFRSTKPILDLVDKTFERPDIAVSLVGAKQVDSIFHYSYRHTHKQDQSGSVELWLETDNAPDAAQKKSAFTSWASIFQDDIGQTSRDKNAEYRILIKIVNRIHNEITAGNWRPEDIMILFRTRNHQMNNLIKMLKWRNLPVSGIDRLVLNQHIVIKDLLAFAQFVTLNKDDFSLACFLKSPFIGWNEEQLYKCSTSRIAGQSLWDHLSKDPEYESEAKWIASAITLADRVPVYEWLSSLLINPCPADSKGSGYRACVARFGQEIIDPLDEMLGDSLRLELQNIRTIPDFINYFGSGAREIKRELSKESGEIRVMTVHASKGLEAPVVIIPDTIAVANHKKTSPIVWTAHKGQSYKLPLLSPFDQKHRSEIYTRLRNQSLSALLDEDKRLLYVALTRAEDSLIVCGAHKATANQSVPKDDSWHHLVSKGFDRLNIAADEQGNRKWGKTYSYKMGSKQNDDLLDTQKDFIIPDCVGTPLDLSLSTNSRSRIVNPSKMTGLDKDSVTLDTPHTSFLGITNGRDRFVRGNITHRLLQVLPEHDPSTWDVVARAYVARNRFGLSSDTQNDIVVETLKVLHHPDFHMVFATGSQAEVPILGKLSSGDIISGQIDRLYIGENEILVVDYKTNRPSPDDVRDIPPSYRAQLGLYKELLGQIYPNKIIKTALLWTDKPFFMPL
jgi:ATP-dependent helicase/nuclease subunit A